MPLLGVLTRIRCRERSILTNMKRFVITTIALFSMVAAFATQADSNFGVGPQYDTTHV